MDGSWGKVGDVGDVDLDAAVTDHLEDVGRVVENAEAAADPEG